MIKNYKSIIIIDDLVNETTFTPLPANANAILLPLFRWVPPSLYEGVSVRPSVRRSVCISRFCKKCMNLRVLCTEMILKAYKVMNNIKTAL